MTTATGLDVFDATVHKTHEWLNDVMDAMSSRDKHEAYSAMRATLHALRDRVTVEEVAQLGAQLPMLIRGFYYEGWDPTGKPVKERHREQFLARIAREFRPANDSGDDDGIDADGAERVARAVFTVLAKRITEGEIDDVKHVLPKDVREFWP
jgi:uncharacterized protein (DUF2267 family)